MQGCIKLIKSDSKDIYNATKDFYFKTITFEFFIHQRNLIFFSSYFPQNILSSFYMLIIIRYKIFLEQQISILEWFLMDHVTLKTGVMMLKIENK